MASQPTIEQLKIIREKAEPIFEHLQRKKALDWARQLEKGTASLEKSDPGLFSQFQKLIAQLKWVACPLIKDEREFANLVRQHSLEALSLDFSLVGLATAKFELLFGVNLRENITGLLSALKANQQLIGTQPIKIRGESNPVQPTIENWLIDFLAETKTKNPTQVEEADYLFNNQNAKNLSEEERKKLGKLLTFYNTFKLYADGLLLREKEFQSAKSTESRPTPAVGRQPGQAMPRPTPAKAKSAEASRPAQPKITQVKPAAPAKPAEPKTAEQDAYREPIEESTSEPESATESEPSEPKIDGNVVDLKGQ